MFEHDMLVDDAARSGAHKQYNHSTKDDAAASAGEARAAAGVASAQAGYAAFMHSAATAASKLVSSFGS